jgi:uncharacterized membrane protein YdbT with pleckstrin-like domain
MSYIEKNLMSGEVIVYRATLHWAIYVPTILMGLFSLLMFVGGAGGAIFGGLLLLFLVLPMGISALVNAKTSEFAVTNKRVMMKFGFIRRSSIEVLLTKVEGISVDQGIIGRLLDYGTIVVGGTGGTKTPFPKIAEPMQFRRRVQEEIEKKTSAPTPA